MPSEYEKNVGILMCISREWYNYYDRAHCENISFFKKKTYGGLKEGFDFYYCWVKPEHFDKLIGYFFRVMPPEMYFKYVEEK